MFKNQYQKIHFAHAQILFMGAVMNNAAENCKKKIADFWLGQNMKNDVNSQEMLCNKISENPRKGFLQMLARGMTKFKNEYIFERFVTQAFFCPRSWNVSQKKLHFGTP